MIKYIESAICIDNNLIFSDVHLGYEKSLSNVQVPLFQFEDVIAQLQKILRNNIFDRIIINGDLKEEFSKINNQEWRHIIQFLEICKDHCEQLIVIQGNHDSLIKPIIEKLNINLTKTYTFNDVFVCHGDETFELPPQIKTIIIGHEHPAITLEDNVRSEKFKCFLRGKYKEKDILVLPAFYSAHLGSDITSNKRMSPYLPKDLGEFEVIIVDDEPRFFGKVKEL